MLRTNDIKQWTVSNNVFIHLKARDAGEGKVDP